MLSTILQIASYVLPCAGFIIFFFKTNSHIEYWESKRTQNGRVMITDEDLYGLGELFLDEIKEEKQDVIIESLFVLTGAACGIIALFL